MDHQQKNQKEMDKDMESNDWLEGEDKEDDRLIVYTQML
jgi:hypothetical protein